MRDPIVFSETNKVGQECPPQETRRAGAPALHKLLFLFFAFRRNASGFGVGLLLGFGFFHCLARLFGFLGASFGALLALLVEDLLAAEEFDECLLGAIAL